MKVGGIGVGCRVIEVIYQYFARGDCGYHTASCARWRSCGGEGKEYLFLMWQTDGFCFEQDETHIALSLLSLAVKYGVPLLEQPSSGRKSWSIFWSSLSLKASQRPPHDIDDAVGDRRPSLVRRYQTMDAQFERHEPRRRDAR